MLILREEEDKAFTTSDAGYGVTTHKYFDVISYNFSSSNEKKNFLK